VVPDQAPFRYEFGEQIVQDGILWQHDPVNNVLGADRESASFNNGDDL
jgi:hypothetical protein